MPRNALFFRENFSKFSSKLKYRNSVADPCVMIRKNRQPFKDFESYEPKEFLRIYKKKRRNVDKYYDPRKDQDYYSKKYRMNSAGKLYKNIYSLTCFYKTYLFLIKKVDKNKGCVQLVN